MSQVLSFHDWFRYGKFAARPRAHAHRSVVPEPFRNIEAGPVHMINVLSPAGAVVDPAVPEYVVHLVLSTPPLLQVGFNRQLQWLVMSPGVILVTPPDTDCDFVSDGASHVLAIGIPKAHVEDFTQDSGARVEIRSEETFRDPRLARQLVRLWHTLSDDEPSGGLLADQVMRGALDTLARRTDGHVPDHHAHDARHTSHASHARHARHARERLPAHTVRRLRDFVECSLADDLEVTMMADVAALSPAHFARAFAATVGMTPFEYVMTRRLARAHELLERTDRSALDIALTVGFKTPSHFASRFRREFGVTPREIRPDSRRPDERLDLDLALDLTLDLALDSQEPHGVVVEDVALI